MRLKVTVTFEYDVDIKEYETANGFEIIQEDKETFRHNPDLLSEKLFFAEEYTVDVEQVLTPKKGKKKKKGPVDENLFEWNDTIQKLNGDK